MKISVSIARDQQMNAEVDNELAVDELAEQFSNPLSASSVRFFRLLVAQISRDYRIELSREDCFKATPSRDPLGSHEFTKRKMIASNAMPGYDMSFIIKTIGQ